MNTQIDFNDIPKNYLYCTHNKCPRHNKCLRYQATLCMPQTLPYYSVVNPSHITGNENNCTFFKPFRTSLFASFARQHPACHSSHHTQRDILSDGAQYVLSYP